MESETMEIVDVMESSMSSSEVSLWMMSCELCFLGSMSSRLVFNLSFSFIFIMSCGNWVAIMKESFCETLLKVGFRWSFVGLMVFETVVFADWSDDLDLIIIW